MGADQAWVGNRSERLAHKSPLQQQAEIIHISRLALLKGGDKRVEQNVAPLLVQYTEKLVGTRGDR